MGSCISTATSNPISDAPPTTSRVITLKGSLTQYSTPVPVSSVLGQKHTSFFLCNSQSLYFDAYIPALPLDATLEPNQVYFMLPVGMLENRLSGSDMASLAGNARNVLARAVKKKNKTRVGPDVAGGASVEDCVRVKRGDGDVGRHKKLGTIEEIADGEM